MSDWTVGQNAVWNATEPDNCPCSCHKPKHEARKPHPNCMAGK